MPRDSSPIRFAASRVQLEVVRDAADGDPVAAPGRPVQDYQFLIVKD
jgi:hypothetical protein